MAEGTPPTINLMDQQYGAAVLPRPTPYFDPARPREAHRRPNGSFAAWMVGISFVGDALAIVAGLTLAFWLRFHTPMRELGRTADSMSFTAYRGHFIFLTITLLGLFLAAHVYGTGRPLRLRKVNALILSSCGLWILAHVGLSFELNTLPIVSRIFLCTAFFTVAGATMLWRAVFDRVLSAPAMAVLLQRRILFVGWSEQATRMLEHIVGERRPFYQVLGCIPSVHGSYDLEPPAALPRLGECAELASLLQDHAVDLVIVADLNPTRGELVDLVTLCEKEIVHLQVIPSCFQVLLSGLHLETTSGVPVLGISRLPLDSPWNQLLKRAVDIAGSVVGLIFGAPFIALFAGLVYLESPGPVFYRQRRNGLGGKGFDILKIRSMKLDAEAGRRPGWSTKEDDRRLRVGAFMRKWNIDEVPQFLNVLRGEMSLVGPRPERPEFIVDFKNQIPHYNARHGVKPGITGWAQVNGLRGDTDLVERIQCDLYYIENWSLVLDVQIMLTTFFTHKGAA